MAKKQIRLKNEQVTKTFNEGFDEFINTCKIKNLRPASIKTYEDSIHYDWYKFFEKDRLISDVDQSVYDNYIIFLKNKGRKIGGINATLKHTKTILNYFIKQEYMQNIEFKRLKEDVEVVEIYSKQELKILLKKPDINKCSFIEYRNWCIINIFLGTGCRVSSLINIKVEDLDFSDGLLLFKHTKNRKQHIIPLSITLKKVLMDYVLKLKLEPSDWLFTNVYKDKLSRFSVNYSINNHCKKLGVSPRGLHNFRHTFAKLWIENGGDIFKLSKILQHRRIDMTQHYISLFAKEIQNIEEFSPLEILQEVKKSKIKLK